MKGIKPIIFKNTSYETYLINEYCTSRLCNIYYNKDKNVVQNMISIINELKNQEKDLYILWDKILE